MNKLGATTTAEFPKSILIVEDDDGLAELFRQSVEPMGLPTDIAATGTEALSKLAANPSCLVLLDYSLPDMTATVLIETLLDRGTVPPFIAITGHGDEQVAVSLMKLGAQEYLIKDAMLLDRLSPAVERVLQRLRVEQQLLESERVRRQNERELAAMYENSPAALFVMDRRLGLLKTNPAAEALTDGVAVSLGLSFGEAFGCHTALHHRSPCGSVPRCSGCALWKCVEKTFETGQKQRQVEIEFRQGKTENTEPQTFLVSTVRLDVNGEPFVLACMEEITEFKRMEARLRQAHRLEAIGQLAGGVAHDFNNLLAVMLLQLDSLEPDLDDTPAQNLVESISEIKAAARRAADLTRQLLAFSRRQVLQTKRLDLNEVVSNLLKMLRRLLGEHIELKSKLEAKGGMWVEADIGMLEQVIVNLAVNARDAMPSGGSLTISTSLAEFADGAVAANGETHEGVWVCLTVADVGCGMDESTLKRVFEPFFTTKEPGKGTGLGLSTVYGIVKQHQGWIDVESSPGVGSTFRVYLPRAGELSQSAAASERSVCKRGSETILLVEDDRSVLEASALCLGRLGYRILKAADGQEALRVWDAQEGRVDLLLTDMIMPEELNGLELARQLREKKPNLKVILTSGYSLELVTRGIKPEQGIVFLPKPCDLATLTKTVRNCLDE